MTVAGKRLYARVGSPITDQGQASAPVAEGWLVCLDLAAEGRLGMEGRGRGRLRLGGLAGGRPERRLRGHAPPRRPAAGDGRLPRRRHGKDPLAAIVCSAETPARGALPECSHGLLTLADGMLYYNTNLGAVAALRADDGRMAWLSLYPRELTGELGNLAAHWRRDPSPCLLDRGTLLVAPADSPRIFAFDAATGTMLWQTGAEVEDALGLLGIAGDSLIAGGGRLYWIGLSGPDRGRVKHVWPDGPDRPGYGRGLIWPAKTSSGPRGTNSTSSMPKPPSPARSLTSPPVALRAAICWSPPAAC